MSDSELVPVVINLNASHEEKLNESFLTMFGSAVESMLNQMFGGSVIDTPSSQSFRSRHELERSVANFERETGIKWPFK